MDLVIENLVIDSIDNQKLSYEQVSSVLEETFLVCGGFHSGLLESFLAKGVYLQECLPKK